MSEIKGKVLKHSEQTRTMHWVHLICFIILGLTGIAFYFDIAGIVNLFGGEASASDVHHWTGVIFTLGPLVYVLFNFERFSKFIDTITTFTKDDFGWLKTMGGYIPFIKAEHIPPQDKYNAGQKMLGLLVIAGCILMIVTGFPMWLLKHSMPAVLVWLTWKIHFWTAVILILAVLGHFFLAAIHPKSRVEFASMMIDGYVDAEYTSHHNAKWFAELKKAE